MALKFHATYLGFQFSSFTSSSLPFHSPNPFKSSRIPNHRFVFRSSQLQQQDELIPFTEAENSLIDALIGTQGRGRSASPQQLNAVERAVQVLEGSDGVPDPTNSSLIEGRWQLMFTTRPGTASPIQRTFVGVDFFSVFQEVYLQTSDPRVSNIVKFSDAIGELKVEAVASIEDGKRILFRFDRASFSFRFLPFKVPYPVPFKLLGDEAKGWLDTTYLSHSGNLRISRGNKVIINEFFPRELNIFLSGAEQSISSNTYMFLSALSNIYVVQGTTFVLQKKTEPRQMLLSAISSGVGIKEAIDELISLSPAIRNGEPELHEGEWLLMWSSQTETDSWIENAANGLMGKQIISKNGRMKFLVNMFPGFNFSMTGNFVKSGSNMYDVTMDDAAIIGGPFGYPVELENKFVLELLYSDGKIRISRGYNKILFVHTRVDG